MVAAFSVMLVNLTSEPFVLIWCNNPWLWGKYYSLRIRRLGNLKYTNQTQEPVLENHMRPISRLYHKRGDLDVESSMRISVKYDLY